MSKANKKAVGAIAHSDGVSFRVWAPFAEAVSVVGSFNEWSPHEMASEGDGYWFVTVDSAIPGHEYKFVIKNGERELHKNDPRSLQVQTNQGNSVIVNQSFDWSDEGFSAPNFNEQVIYELHVGTFNRVDASTIGTFEQVIEKLDHLCDLGINTIELMPITSMSEDRGWGYATDYIYAVESMYGGRRQFLEFVNAAHARGIGVTLDVVYNHIGPDDELDLWQFDGWSQDNKGGIYFYNDWRSTTPWGETRPDYGRPEVRQYILDNVRMWLSDCHLDGLRLDSTIYMRNVKGLNNSPENDIAEGWSLMQSINNLARKINPGALMIAEDSSGNEYMTKPKDQGGAGFSTQWEVSFPSVLHSVLDAVSDNDRNVSAVAEAMSRYYNGDAFQKVIYSDSHDTAGNAGGARLDEEIAPGNASTVYARKRSLIASSIVLTAPGIPMLFQGQEFMESGNFTDWKVLDWKKAEHFAGIVLAHKHLIALRRNLHGNTKGLTGHGFKVIHQNDEAKVLAYFRWDQGGAGDDVIIICNFANKTLDNYIIDFPGPGIWKVRFNSDWKGYSQDFKDISQSEVIVDKSSGSLKIGAYAVLILSQDNY
jgi:1,4-alpha-glucan branching enzyme